jgi:Zn2+/Cd2+-exporting ATPase
MKKVSFKINGMDCAEEVTLLKREVAPLVGGEDNLQFDILTGKMSVISSDGNLSDSDIIAAVAKTGMKAFLWDMANFQKESAKESLWIRKGRLIVCSVSGLFLLAGLIIQISSNGNIIDVLADRTEYGLIAIILFTIAAISGGWFVFPKAYLSLRRFRPDMNLLMTVAALGAMILGQWFEAATVTFLFGLALLLESWSVGRARHAIAALMDLSPTMARVICPHHGDIEEKPVEQVVINTIVIVKPGEKIPLDGIITSGKTTANQAPITGESVPVEKDIGDEVFAGTINNDGAIQFRVTKESSDTTLARIIHMVEEAQSRRAPSEQWVDKFARTYTPVMMGVAMLITVFRPLLFDEQWLKWFYEGLVVLVIACPCALVISTPVSIVAGLAAAARAGILIKGGAILEIPARLKAIAIDKTGTLTIGRPSVKEVIPLSGHTSDELLSRAAAMESDSEHPYAKAILKKAAEEGVVIFPAEGFQAIKGKGAEAYFNGKLYWLGSHRMVHEMGKETPECHRMVEELEKAGQTVIAIGNDNHVCGLISVTDAIRPQAKEMITALHDAGVKKVVLLTGDNEGTAASVAGAVGIDDYRAELLPQDKVRAIELLKEKYKDVAMVGDGVNDAPAMAVSSFGIAMGAAGSDAAIETADIALMSDDLSRLPWLIYHSRRVLHVIKQNIWFALGIKFVFLALAMTGKATLWMAIAADMGVSLLVIFNSLRLLKSRME